MEPVILHCDLNAFFVSVACLDNPTIKNLPVAVCGSIQERHGIVLAKNAAAAACNIKTGEVIWQARQKCPELVTVPPNYNRYKTVSQAARSIYGDFTDIVEPFGIDECWLDVGASAMLFGDGEHIAKKISRRIKRELGVTISVGVSFNKVFAKFGSDYKKPDAVTVIDRQSVKDIIWPQRVNQLIGIGPSTVRRLADMGIFTVGDLALCDPNALRLRFGKIGDQLYKIANGSSNEVNFGFHSTAAPKSIGRSVTCVKDVSNVQMLFNVLIVLAEDVARQLRQKGLYAGGVVLHVRDCNLNVKEFSEKLARPIRLSRDITDKALDLFVKNCDFTYPFRSVGVRATYLTSEPDGWQTDIFSDIKKDIRKDALEAKMFDIRNRFGEKSIMRCCVLSEDDRLCPDYEKGGKPCSFGYI